MKSKVHDLDVEDASKMQSLQASIEPRMSDEHAKHILDFLARKAGGVCIAIDEMQEVVIKDKHGIASHLYFIDERCHLKKLEAFCSCYFKEILDRILKMSKSNEHILCSGFNLKPVFLPPGSCLEELEVKADLDVEEMLCLKLKACEDN